MDSYTVEEGEIYLKHMMVIHTQYSYSITDIVYRREDGADNGLTLYLRRVEWEVSACPCDKVHQAVEYRQRTLATG